MITAISEAGGGVLNVLTTSGGRLLVETAPKCQDLGCVIAEAAGQAGYQVPVNGVVNAPSSHSGLGWVRTILFGLHSGGTFDVGYQRYIGGFTSYLAVVSGLAGQSGTSIAARAVAPDDLSGKSIIGDTCRFYVKNVGSSAADVSLYVQVMA